MSRTVMIPLLVATVWSGVVPFARAVDEKPAGDPKPNVPLQLPHNWRLLGLTNEQNDNLRAIQAAYRAQAKVLKAELQQVHRQYQQTLLVAPQAKSAFTAYQQAYEAQRQERQVLLERGKAIEARTRELEQKLRDEMDGVLTEQQQSKMKTMYVKENLVPTTQSLAPPMLWKRIQLSSIQMEQLYPILRTYKPKLADVSAGIAEADRAERSAFAAQSLRATANKYSRLPGMQDGAGAGLPSLRAGMRHFGRSASRLRAEKHHLEQEMLGEMEAVLTSEQKKLVQSLKAGALRR